MTIAHCSSVDQAVMVQIEAKIAYFRSEIAKHRAAGKAIGYLSVPLASAGGGVFHINAEIAASTADIVEQRFGCNHAWILNPAVKEADLEGGSGTDYMVMWTAILEGEDGHGAIDFAYFVGPEDVARYFGLEGKGDLERLERYFDLRVVTDKELQNAVDKGLTRAQFRNYYGLKAAANVSRGAHDEWNLIRSLNERRRRSEKFGIANQITPFFDGRGVSPADYEASTSHGYLGKWPNI
jgi:hypothetical protein